MLQRLIEQLRDLSPKSSAWDYLAGDWDWLRKDLRGAVNDAHAPGLAEELTESWDLLSSEGAAEGIEGYCRRQTPPVNGDPVDATRLHGNAGALIATAAAVVTFEVAQSTNDDRARSSLRRDVVEWWRKAAPRLGDHVADSVPPETGSEWTILGLADHHSHHGWDLTATRYWTEYWIGEKKTGRAYSGTKCKPVSVATAAVYGASPSEPGFIADLVIEPLASEKTRLIDHPESALLALSKRWLETLNLSMRESLRISTEPQWRSFCWSLKCQPEALTKAKHAFFGNSHGGAAARGFWHAANGKIPDEGVIVLTSAEPVWEKAVFGNVDGVKGKVQAIIADGRFDTIVVADKDNADEAKKALGSHKGIRVVHLDGGSPAEP